MKVDSLIPSLEKTRWGRNTQNSSTELLPEKCYRGDRLHIFRQHCPSHTGWQSGFGVGNPEKHSRELWHWRTVSLDPLSTQSLYMDSRDIPIRYPYRGRGGREKINSRQPGGMLTTDCKARCLNGKCSCEKWTQQRVYLLFIIIIKATISQSLSQDHFQTIVLKILTRKMAFDDLAFHALSECKLKPFRQQPSDL